MQKDIFMSATSVIQTRQISERELLLPRDDVIVSKTDLTGRITYANRTFCLISGFAEAELLGAPHSIVRHPDMPRAVFKLLWDTLCEGREIFAYVKNRSRSGDYYWVFAHATPSFNSSGTVIGFHSNRRAPERKALATIAPVYADVLQEERKHKNGKAALAAGTTRLMDIVRSKGLTYDELVFSI